VARADLAPAAFVHRCRMAPAVHAGRDAWLLCRTRGAALPHLRSGVLAWVAGWKALVWRFRSSPFLAAGSGGNFWTKATLASLWF